MHNDLHKEMRCGLLSNEKGEILLIYDGELASYIQWVEYNPSNEIFSLIHLDGTAQKK